jgi:excisionase family DNA binding protein
MELLSIPNAAVRLDVTPAALYKWARQGRLRLYRVGSRSRVALADVLELKPVGTYPPPVKSARSRDAHGQFSKTI